ncbi:L,D-transpeptidase family protein [Primorskyibacter sp. S87]|uniref:L,D-transpeptidase family protein n=1 Tax=Primorskyibacter sp. S87 TaxID=3415126 RepID=UPI003C79A3CD
MHIQLRLFSFGFAILFLLILPVQTIAAPVSEQIKTLLDANGAATSAKVQNTSLDAKILVPRFYEQRGFAPAWEDAQAVEELLGELKFGVEQGFEPEDFHFLKLQELAAAAQGGGTEAQAMFDIVATDAAVKLIHHLVFGKVDPAALHDEWNFSKTVIEQDPAVILNEYINGEGFPALINRIAVDNPQYRMLVGALARYRTIAEQGGWPHVPDQTVLKPGMTDPAVAVLRQRFAAEGVLRAMATDATSENNIDPHWVYDDKLAEDVKAFQTRHGLEADGVIGPRTFLSLNQPVEDRINKIRLSLERGRWLMRETGDEFVLVNIAGARTYLVKSDGTLWTTRSITGSAYRKTPVFRDEIKYMEFNPTWTVPASIFRKDKLSRIRKDPGYLSRNNYIVRNSNGQVIPTNAVNWSANNPGVTLVQKPGPENALGLVKFMFPNKYSVYLHDTNDKGLFDRNERNLSSGCVRLEYPFEFANLLMEGDPEWSQEKMQAILDSGKTTRVDLPNPIPVLLTYWTAWVEGDQVHFREDPYQRDGPILEALKR